MDWISLAHSLEELLMFVDWWKNYCFVGVAVLIVDRTHYTGQYTPFGAGGGGG